jgi:hypothetical protein
MPVETALSGGGDAELAAKIAEAEGVVEPTVDTSGYAAVRNEGEPAFIEVRGQKFRLIPKLPAMTMLDLAMAGDPAATDMERLRAVRSFIDIAVVPEQAPAFQRLLRSTDDPIGMDELMKVIEKAVELLTGRPTE